LRTFGTTSRQLTNKATEQRLYKFEENQHIGIECARKILLVHACGFVSVNDVVVETLNLIQLCLSTFLYVK